MPLSEHEQRILAELEESLSKQDPRFAKNVRETNVYSHGGRRVRWGVAGFVVGLLILILCLLQIRAPRTPGRRVDVRLRSRNRAKCSSHGTCLVAGHHTFAPG